MATESTRSRRKDKIISSKLCVYCSKVKPLNDFYGNKGWAAQSFHDAWCKECVVKYCTDKDTLRAYCFYNNRKWSEEMYESAVKKARYTLANDPVYLDTGLPEERRNLAEARAITRSFFSMMNLGNRYGYVANIGEDGAYKEFDPSVPDRDNTEDGDDK